MQEHAASKSKSTGKIQEERRKFSRVDFDADVTVQQGDRVYSTRLIDVSLNGLLVKTPEVYHLRSDMPCTVSIILAEHATITMQVDLIHCSGNALGFQCTSIDMDSITHLRRLTEANLEDDQAAERVLSELVGKAHMQ